jgi:tetratricopeptide (TPR) repeat protein
MNKNIISKIVGIMLICLFAISLSSIAQMRGVWLPPNGDNQKNSISLWVGLVEVSVTYHSPNVTHPYTGEDRKGKIWGETVPYGAPGEDNESVWRAGANANTIFSISHDVLIEGETLVAGKYGLFIIPMEDEWVVIFSKESHSWGAFAYDKSEDALRVTIKPKTSEYRQWLAYDFTEKKSDAATVSLKWDNIQLPIKIEVPNSKELYVERLRSDMKYGARWESSAIIEAVNYCIENEVNLEEALEWADRAISYSYNGQQNFKAYYAKSSVLKLLGREDEAEQVFVEALNSFPNDVNTIYWEGRLRVFRGEKETAMRIFQYNKKKFPKNRYHVNLGLAYGYDALDNTKEAIKYLGIAMKHIPEEEDKRYPPFFEKWLKRLKQGS